MKLIAHRGNIWGPNPERENHPDYIDEAIAQGYDVEVDLWLMEVPPDPKWIVPEGHKDYAWFTGHDAPQYEISFTRFITWKQNVWFHCKNVSALYALGRLSDGDHNFFWHQEDDFTLTSQGYIWTYPGKELTIKSVCVMPEWTWPTLEIPYLDVEGICSDYVGEL